MVDYLQGAGYRVVFEADTAAHMAMPGIEAMSATQIGESASAAIVMGGDGTMLGIARQLAPYDVPLIGINQGRLGFITDIALGDFEAALAPILEGDFDEEQRAMLEGEVERDGKTIFASVALNDVIVSRGATAGMVELRIEIDGQFVAQLRADGLIIGSPTGSTAYALSAGGPILHPKVAGWALVPIAPHDLSNRPIVVPDSGEVQIEIVAGRDASVNFDMQSLTSLVHGDRIRVRRSADRVRFLQGPFDATLADADLAASVALQMRIRDDITATSDMVNTIEILRKQLEDVLARRLVAEIATRSPSSVNGPRSPVAIRSTRITLACSLPTNISITMSPSFSRNRPWSTNTQVSWSPIASWISTAATALSTPPDRPQMTRPLPTWANCLNVAVRASRMAGRWAGSSRSASASDTSEPRCRDSPAGRVSWIAPRAAAMDSGSTGRLTGASGDGAGSGGRAAVREALQRIELPVANETVEEFSGPLVPLAGPKRVEDGFRRHAEAGQAALGQQLGALRDQLNDEFKAVWCDNEEAYESIVRFMQRFQPAWCASKKPPIIMSASRVPRCQARYFSARKTSSIRPTPRTNSPPARIAAGGEAPM